MKAFNKKERDVFIKIWDVEEAVHNNQTGKFRVQSQTRNYYIMIMTHVDSNAVLAEPMKNCTCKRDDQSLSPLASEVTQGGVCVYKAHPRQ